MAVKINTPITVPAATVVTPAQTYDTLLVLDHVLTYNPKTGKRSMGGHAALGAVQSDGTYKLLPGSTQRIQVTDVAPPARPKRSSSSSNWPPCSGRYQTPSLPPAVKPAS